MAVLTAASTTADAPARRPSNDRLRLAVLCLAIVALVFWQSSGQVATDTKLDLVVDPWRYLVRSLVMWNPNVDSGSLGDQAYGYLFPMGPFFLLGHVLHLPAWETQRAWESLVLVVPFLGMVRLTRLLGVQGFWPRVAAGLAYALAPRMLSELGQISAELLPTAALPWMLIPLVRGSREGSPRRAAARSGAAFLLAGGINAAASLAVLPVPALWLLTRQRGPRRAALIRWWVAATVLASLWWLVPLAVLGRYSPPFLSFIESSSVTTSTTSLTAVLRGVEHWESYLGSSHWPAGWLFVSAGAVVLSTGLLAAGGLAALSRRRFPERAFLVTTLLVGSVLLTLGHASGLHPLAAGWWRTELDTSLDAFRNIHKFDPLVRLPLAVGVGAAVGAVLEWGRREEGRWRPLPSLDLSRRVVLAVPLLGIAASALTPALANAVVAQPRTVTEASWWPQTAAWLAGHAHGGRALVVPGGQTPTYVWGATTDDAMQPVATTPWTVKGPAPFAQPAYIRLLNEIDTFLASGQGNDALAAVLARSGIRYVVVRDDLDSTLSATTPTAVVRTTIEDSPGFQRVAAFGHRLLPATDSTHLVDEGATTSDDEVAVYADAAWTGMTALVPTADAVTANGSADDLVDLLASGVVGPEQPVLFTDGAGAPSALDDGIRRREAAFASTVPYSGTMLAGQPYLQRRAVHDYLPTPAPPLSAYRLVGIAGLTASSSGTDATAAVNRSPADGPWAALDDDPATAWRSGSYDGLVGQWWQVRLAQPLSAGAIQVAFAGSDQDFPDRVAVTTNQGRLVQTVAADAGAQQLDLPPGPATRIRITILHIADGSRGYGAGLASVVLPGVLPARTLAIPGTASPTAITFSAASGTVPQCLTVDGAPACGLTTAQTGEEEQGLDRTFTLSAAHTYRVAVTVAPRDGAALDRLLDAGLPLAALASSQDSDDPRERPGAAVDGDPRTGWVAKPGDGAPSLLVSSSQAREVSGVRLQPMEGAPVTAATRVLVQAGDESVTAAVPADGEVLLPRPVATKQVRVTVLASGLRSSLSTTDGHLSLLPVAIGELALLDGEAPAVTAPTVRLPCGSGPRLYVDGAVVRTSVTAAVSDLLAGQPVAASPCTPTVPLASGGHRLVAPSTAALAVTRVTLTSGEPATLAGPEPVAAVAWGDTHRVVRVTATSPSLLVVRENANAGWRATLHGHVLPAVTVDGWEQGWRVPAGAAGEIVLDFRPQGAVAAGLVVGALAVLVLLALAVRSSDGLAPALGAAVAQRRVTVAVVLTAGLLLGSVPGLALALVVLLYDRIAWVAGRPRWVPSAALAAAALMAMLCALGRVDTAHPLGDNRFVDLLALAAVLLAATRLGPRRDAG